MIKLAAACILRVCVKLAKNAAIRGAHEAAGKPLASIMIDGACGVTDEAVDRAFKWLAERKNPAQRREEAEAIANMTPAEVEAGVASAIDEEAPDATPEVKVRALTLATRAARNLHCHLSQPDAKGRSVLGPGARLDAASDVARLLQPVAAHLLAPGDEVAGRYTIQRFIAQGGMGAVYLATQKKIRRTVALKTILPAIAAQHAFRKRFFEEAELVAKLSHPNIVPLYDADEDPGRDLCFLAMQHLGGMTLDLWLRRRPVGCSVAEFSRLAVALCSALAHAHDRGVLHLDLKPTNIMVSDDLSEVFVLDFGLGKACGESAGAAAMVTTVGGTPYYMAPEQLRGGKADARADVYALGVIFYEALTGQMPVAGCRPVSRKRVDVSAELSEAIADAMNPDLAERTKSVQALRATVKTTPPEASEKAVERQPRTQTRVPADPPEKVVQRQPGTQAQVPADHWAHGLGLTPAKMRAWDRFCFETGSDDWVAHSGERLQRNEKGIARARERPVGGGGGGGGMNVRRLVAAARQGRVAGGPLLQAAPARMLPDKPELRDQIALIEGIVRKQLKLASNIPLGTTAWARVEELGLTREPITDAGVAWLSRPDSGLKALTSLSLCDTRVTDAGVNELARAETGLKALASLYLGWTKVTDAGVKELAQPDTGLRALTLLGLGGTPVTDAGVKELAQPDTGLKALTSLDLSYTRVTDAGVNELARAETGLDGLTTLWLVGTKVSFVAVAAAKARFPAIKIIH